MNTNYKLLIKNILIPIILGAIVGLLTSSGNNYNELIQPDFAPPAIIFPIVWTILYILMGISNYIIEISTNKLKYEAMNIYYFQLIINLIWSFFFFIFKQYFFSFIWIIFLIIIVSIMIIKFYKIDKTSAIIQLPYLSWIIFAAILNYSVYTLN